MMLVIFLPPPLEGDEKVRTMSLLKGNEEEAIEGTGIKILPPSKLFTRLPVLLPQIKAENSS